MAGQARLTGPDFGAGVGASTVRDGEPLLGHANGEAVLLVRRGDDFLAIGATCTHYGGPLAVHIMTNTALTGATYDIDGGQQLVAGV